MKDNKLNVDELVLYSTLYETLKKQGVEDVENEINNLTGEKFDKLAILQRKWQKFDTHDRELVKEVCEKIKLKFSDTRTHNWGIEQFELYEFLDQIQKEIEDENNED